MWTCVIYCHTLTYAHAHSGARTHEQAFYTHHIPTNITQLYTYTTSHLHKCAFTYIYKHKIRVFKRPSRDSGPRLNLCSRPAPNWLSVLFHPQLPPVLLHPTVCPCCCINLPVRVVAPNCLSVLLQLFHPTGCPCCCTQRPAHFVELFHPTACLSCSEKCYRALEELRPTGIFQCTCRMRKLSALTRCQRIQFRVAKNRCLGERVFYKNMFLKP